MLDVERGVDVDAGAEQLLDVLPALGVARARARWCAPARRPGSARGGARARRRGRTPRARVPRYSIARRGSSSSPSSSAAVSARPCVSTTPTTHVHAGAHGARAPRLEHGVGLAHAGGGAEEDLELGPALALLPAPDALEQLLRDRGDARATGGPRGRPGCGTRRAGCSLLQEDSAKPSCPQTVARTPPCARRRAAQGPVKERSTSSCIDHIQSDAARLELLLEEEDRPGEKRHRGREVQSRRRRRSRRRRSHRSGCPRRTGSCRCGRRRSSATTQPASAPVCSCRRSPSGTGPRSTRNSRPADSVPTCGKVLPTTA